MKMKKSLLCLFLALVMVAIFVSCGDNASSESKVPDGTNFDSILDGRLSSDTVSEDETGVKYLHETQENYVAETKQENIYETSKNINADYKGKFSTWEEFK